MHEDQKINLLRLFIHFLIFLAFSYILGEWALGLAVSVFSSCLINKIAKKLLFALE